MGAVLPDLFNIFTHIVFPVLLIVAAGYLTEKKFRFELTALTKLFFYVITPCLVFTRIYATSPSWQEYGLFSLFAVGMMVCMGVVGLFLALLRRFPPSMRAAFILSVMMCNSGNYGLPVIELMFNGNAYASSIQLIVMTTQGIINYTFGIFLMSRGSATFRESVKNTFRYPLIYTVLLVFLFKGFDIPVWGPVWVTMEKISMAFVPMALFTLGAQLGRIRFGRGITNVFISAGLRLLLAPCIGFCVIKLFGFSGITAQVLFVGTSLPSAVNTALLAVELKNEPEFASQAVFFSTLASFFTVSLAIWVARMWVG
jgi:predicted permease